MDKRYVERKCVYRGGRVRRRACTEEGMYRGGCVQRRCVYRGGGVQRRACTEEACVQRRVYTEGVCTREDKMSTEEDGHMSCGQNEIMASIH